MKARIKIILGITAAISLSAVTNSLAAGWKEDAGGWWWQEDDGSYPSSTWKWLDGDKDGIAECYYFNSAGYMLSNTLTPDGYIVNKNGAWVDDGIIQTQPSEYAAAKPAVIAEYSGTGDQVITGVNIPEGVYKVSTTHSSKGYFGVSAYNSDGDRRGLLGNYSGTGSSSTLLHRSITNGYIEIESDGKWTITIEKIEDGGTSNMKGTGDCVTQYFSLPAGPLIATVTYNGAGYFGATMYDSDGEYCALLGNNAGSYSGETLVRSIDPSKKYCIEVESEGDWTIDFGLGETVSTYAPPTIPVSPDTDISSNQDSANTYTDRSQTKKEDTAGVSPSEDPIQTLTDYLLRHGSSASYDTKVIRETTTLSDGAGATTYLAYHVNDGTITFHMDLDKKNKYALYVEFNYDVSALNAENDTIYFSFNPWITMAGVSAKADFEIGTFTKNTLLDFNATSIFGNGDLIEYNELANEAVQTAMISWQYLCAQAGISLKDLGFLKYK